MVMASHTFDKARAYVQSVHRYTPTVQLSCAKLSVRKNLG